MISPPPPPVRRLSIAWSQDELHRRTRFERVVARCSRAAATAGGIAAVTMTILAIVGVALAEQALHPARRAPPAHALEAARAVAASAGAAVADVQIVGSDGVLLRGWSFMRRGRARGTVLLLHGLGDSRDAELPMAGMLVAGGYDVVAPDSRAHGASGGTLATYGLLERHDVRTWADWIRRRRPDECVFAVGTSMGGAIAMQALGAEPFCALIVEAPYATFRGTATLRIGRQLDLPDVLGQAAAWPFVTTGMLYAKLRYGLSFWRADPIDAVAHSRVPVLVIEDGSDERVASNDAERIAAANPGHVHIWTVAGASHAQAWRAAPHEFPRRVLAFLDAHQ